MRCNVFECHVELIFSCLVYLISFIHAKDKENYYDSSRKARDGVCVWDIFSVQEISIGHVGDADCYKGSFPCECVCAEEFVLYTQVSDTDLQLLDRELKLQSVIQLQNLEIMQKVEA